MRHNPAEDSARPPLDHTVSGLVLGIDTCGPTGSVALGRISDERTLQVLAQIELEGRTYSATLVSAVADLLGNAGLRLRDLACIVVVNGPGSFTGVRVGLGTIKGLAEGAQLPVAAISRLKVLALRAGCTGSALDAHRHEVFLRFSPNGEEPRELLAGAADLKHALSPSHIAVCDDAAASLIAAEWPETQLIRVPPPTAGDALASTVDAITAGHFTDLALLDGHYLRRSDAEIFGPQGLRTP